jgi:ADP-ribose pyrophosphatase
MENWKTLSRTRVSDYGWRLKIEKHHLVTGSGEEISDWMWVHSPPFVNVIVCTTEGTWIVFKQTKYAIGELLGKDVISLAPVGGYVEKGEDPLGCAKRELLEEIGYVSDEWIQLSGDKGLVTDANRGSGVAHLFLAKNSRKVGKSGTSDDLEEQIMVELSTAEIEDAVLRGEFKCQSWAACIALALLHLRKS